MASFEALFESRGTAESPAGRRWKRCDRNQPRFRSGDSDRAGPRRRSHPTPEAAGRRLCESYRAGEGVPSPLDPQSDQGPPRKRAAGGLDSGSGGSTHAPPPKLTNILGTSAPSPNTHVTVFLLTEFANEGAQTLWLPVLVHTSSSKTRQEKQQTQRRRARGFGACTLFLQLNNANEYSARGAQLFLTNKSNIL